MASVRFAAPDSARRCMAPRAPATLRRLFVVAGLRPVAQPDA